MGAQDGTCPDDVRVPPDPHWQLHEARRYVVGAGVAADTRCREPADRWGLALAALQETLALLESGGAPHPGRPDTVAPAAQSCAELIRYAVSAIRTVPGWNHSPELADAFRVALVALELVERQEAG